jgi:hypothetical protein
MQTNPIPAGQDQIGFDEPLPPVPEYKAWSDPIEKSEAFVQLDTLFSERIGVIDGAMGTNIQDFKLGEEDYRGERYKVRPSATSATHSHSTNPWCTSCTSPVAAALNSRCSSPEVLQAASWSHNSCSCSNLFGAFLALHPFSCTVVASLSITTRISAVPPLRKAFYVLIVLLNTSLGDHACKSDAV